MDVATVYDGWKTKVLNLAKVDPPQVVGDGQCVSLVVNNDQSYTSALFPDAVWEDVMSPVASALELADKSNRYLTWVENNHADVNQLPSQGDIMVFGATPAEGYTNTFANAAGHCGVCDSSSSSAYCLLQQNAPASGASPNITNYPWNFRPCLGWYTINPQDAPDTAADTSETPEVGTIDLPANEARASLTLHIDQDNTPFSLYPADGPYVPKNVKIMPNGQPAIIVPAAFEGGITYENVTYKGDGVYVVDTQDFGVGAIWTTGSKITVTGASA